MSAMSNITDRPIISADSHVMEPPDTYLARIDHRYRDTAPRVEKHADRGDIYVVPGMKATIPMGLVAAAGKTARELAQAANTATFEDLHRGGWDPHARLAEQDRDGVAAEIIYPSVGMVLCNHPDGDYKQACFDAYNLWIAEYCDPYRTRLLGLGQTAMRSPADGIRDLERIKQLGLRGVMMPGFPVQADYDDPMYDEFWEAAIALQMPLSFHILTNRDGLNFQVRGSAKLNGFMTIIRGCQDIMGMMILGGVFERHPKLKIVCVEADAGWVPHYMYRMDHGYERHRYWLKAEQLSKAPSEYFRENIYVTFQDDWVAFKMLDLCNPRRLMWANDFPHSDSTWPHSQALLAEHTAHLSPIQRDWLLHDNVAELYHLDRADLLSGSCAARARCKDAAIIDTRVSRLVTRPRHTTPVKRAPVRAPPDTPPAFSRARSRGPQ